MITLLQIVLTIVLAFAAIVLACAVAIALPRNAGIGRRVAPSADPHFFQPADVAPWADPYTFPFGDMPPPLPAGSIVERHDHPARPATRADQGSGGNGNDLSGAAAARTFRGRGRRAF